MGRERVKIIVDLGTAKKYLRLEEDFDEDDSEIKMFIDVAEEYIYNATGKQFDSTNPIAKLAVLLLVSHWYENRMVITIGTISKQLEKSLSSLLMQLKYCYGGSK